MPPSIMRQLTKDYVEFYARQVLSNVRASGYPDAVIDEYYTTGDIIGNEDSGESMTIQISIDMGKKRKRKMKDLQIAFALSVFFGGLSLLLCLGLLLWPTIL